MRFPQHDEAWAFESLENIFEYFPTSSYSWSELNYESGNALNIHYGLIHKGVLPTLTNVENIKLPFVNEGLNHQKYTRIENGDIIFADASEDTSAVGKCVEIINTANKTIISGSHTLHSRNKTQNFAEGFLGYYLNSLPFKSKIKKLAVGTKVYQISTKNISSLTIYYPTVDEQKKITKLLNLLDQKIETQSKIIEHYKTLIKGIRHSFFKEPSIDKKHLKNFMQIGKAGGTPKTTNPSYYNGPIYFLSISDITEQGKFINYCSKTISVDGLENSSAWIVPEGSLILSMYASVGLPCINLIPLATSQAMFSIVVNDDASVEYLYQFLMYFKDTQLHSLLETGTQSNINSEHVKNIVVPVYDRQRMSTFENLSKKVETIIFIEKQKLDCINIVKKTIMNLLFI